MADPLDFKAGDRLRAAQMQEIARRLDHLEGVRSSGRIQVRKGGRGPMQVAYVEGVTTSLGKAVGSITALSGTTPGTGTVDFWWINGSGTLEATGQSETVSNVDTAISSGKYVWVQQDSFGAWFVSPMQCE